MVEHILGSLKPLYYFLTLVGLIGFKINHERKTIAPSHYWLISSTISSAILTTICYATFVILLVNKNKLGLLDYLTIFNLTSLLLKNIAFNGLRWAHRTKTMRLWNELVKLDDELRAEGMRPRYCKYSGVVPIAIQNALKLILIASSNIFFQSIDAIMVCVLILQIQEFRFSAATAEYVTLFSVMKNCFGQLERKFNNLGRTVAYDVDSDVRKIQKCYYKLNELSQSISGILWPHVVAMVAENAATIAIYVYDTLTNLYKDGDYESMPTAVIIYGILDACLSLIPIIGISQMCTNNANKIKRTLANVKISTRSAPISKNLTLFSLQLLHEDFKISAGGLFVVDLQLVFAISGALTAYIIIIIQFDLMYFT